MIKKLIIFIALIAFAKDSCYSISFFSSYKKPSNSFLKKYPKDAVLMKIHNVYSLRYKCVNRYKDIKEIYNTLKFKYKNIIITKTYKFRFKQSNVSIKKSQSFFVNKKVRKKKITKYKYSRKVSASNQELKLLYQVFIYKSNLDEAIKIARLGVKKYPNSYEWNLNLANALNWKGKGKEALKYFKRAYNLKHSYKLKKIVEKLALSSGDSNLAIEILKTKLKKRFSLKEFKQLVSIYYQKKDYKAIANLINRYIRYLKNNHEFIKMSLNLLIQQGKLKEAKKFATLLEKTNYSKEEALLLSSYYYKLGDINKAFDVLVKCKSTKKEPLNVLVNYYINITDLGWFRNHKKEAAFASMQLIKLNRARTYDYIRVSMYYKKSDKFLKNAYLKFKTPDLFFAYAYRALALKHYKELNNFISKVKNPKILSNLQFYLIKSRLAYLLKDTTAQKEALLKILELSKDNISARLSLIWIFMNKQDVFNLEKILMYRPTKTLYFTYASAYFYLKKINLAAKYAKKILDSDLKIKNSSDFKFLLAYIYKAQLKEGAYKSIIFDLYKNYKNQLINNPNIIKNSKFAINYLRSAFVVLSSDEFLYLLLKYKKYIPINAYNELYYSLLTKHSQSKAHIFLEHLRQKQLWMIFSDAIYTKNDEKLAKLLDTYLYVLSRGDVIYQLKQRGEISKAQSLNFESFEDNTFNNRMYMQHRDLSKQRTNLYEFKTLYITFKSLEGKTLYFKNRRYYDKGFYYTFEATKTINKNKNEEFFKETPNVSSLAFSIEKRFKRYKNKTQISINKNKNKFIGIKVENSYKLDARTNLSLIVAKNQITLDSTILYLAAKEDYIKPSVTYNILSSLYLNGAYTLKKYSTSDNEKLGGSNIVDLSITKNFIYDYPNLSTTLYYKKIKFQKAKATASVREILKNDLDNVLPPSFKQIGTNFYYGNSDLYIKNWRWFVNGGIAVSKDEYKNKSIGLNLGAGYGGRVFRKDHLLIGTTFSRNAENSSSSVLQLYLDYKFLTK